MRFIGIGGLFSNDNPIWHRLIPAFKRRFDISEFHVLEETNCQLYEWVRMRRFIESIVEKYDDGVPTLLVGHSMGGVFACSVTSRLRETKICGIVTINSPHTYPALSLYNWYLKGSERLKMPIVTFGSTKDWVVAYGTEHPQSASHTTLEADHYKDIAMSNKLADVIARTSRKFIAPEPET